MNSWRRIVFGEFPELENVLTCIEGHARSAHVAFFGDGSRKYPACWIDAHTRDELYKEPSHWSPIETVPGCTNWSEDNVD